MSGIQISQSSAPEFFGAQSDSFDFSTSGYASFEYAQMVNNSVTLGPGSWRLTGTLIFRLGTATGVVLLTTRWGTSNGDNTSTVPPFTGVTFDGGAIQFFVSQDVGSTQLGSFDSPTGTLRITTTAASTELFLIARAGFTVAGTGEFTVLLEAERVA